MVPGFGWLAFMNGGEPYDKLPRFVPYFVLPLSMLLLTIRWSISAIEILKGKRDSIIASHEVVEELEDRDAHVEKAATPAKEATHG